MSSSSGFNQQQYLAHEDTYSSTYSGAENSDNLSDILQSEQITNIQSEQLKRSSIYDDFDFNNLGVTNHLTGGDSLDSIPSAVGFSLNLNQQTTTETPNNTPTTEIDRLQLFGRSSSIEDDDFGVQLNYRSSSDPTIALHSLSTRQLSPELDIKPLIRTDPSLVVNRSSLPSFQETYSIKYNNNNNNTSQMNSNMDGIKMEDDCYSLHQQSQPILNYQQQSMDIHNTFHMNNHYSYQQIPIQQQHQQHHQPQHHQTNNLTNLHQQPTHQQGHHQQQYMNHSNSYFPFDQSQHNQNVSIHLFH